MEDSAPIASQYIKSDFKTSMQSNNMKGLGNNSNVNNEINQNLNAPNIQQNNQVKILPEETKVDFKYKVIIVGNSGVGKVVFLYFPQKAYSRKTINYL